MICPKCNHEIGDDLNYCPNCGTNLKEPNKSIEEKIDDFSNTVASGVEEGFRDISEGVKNTAEDIKESFQERADNVKEKANSFSESIKTFDFSNFLTKQYVDIGICLAVILPLFLALLTTVQRFIVGALVDLSYAFDSSYTFFIPIFNFLNVVVKFFVWLTIAIQIYALVMSIYRIIKYKEQDNANIFAIIGVSLALLATLGYAFYQLKVLKFLMIGGLAIGFDLCVKVFIKKEEISGNINYNEDINLINEKYKERKVKKEVEDNTSAEQIKDPVKYVEGKSYFDGTGGELFAAYLLLILLSLITCGIATPYALVKVTEWRISHTIIDGRRQTFNGTATQLFGLWIKWWLLSIITCGIYSYFAYVDYLKWETKHTSYEGILPNADGYFTDSKFVGNSFEYLGYSLLASLLIGITCGLAYPWTISIIHKWKMKNTIIDNRKLEAENANGSDFFGQYIVNCLLIYITCGIYSPWALCRENNFLITNTHNDKYYHY